MYHSISIYSENGSIIVSTYLDDSGKNISITCENRDEFYNAIGDLSTSIWNKIISDLEDEINSLEKLIEETRKTKGKIEDNDYRVY